jgi:MATE family multidrug resistance protein
MAFWCMFLMLAMYVWLTPYYRRFEIWTDFGWPEGVSIQRLLTLGGPIGLSLMLQAGLFTSLALLMGMLGPNYAAAHQIALNYAGLVFMVPLGLAFATAVLVGQAIGRQAPYSAKRIGIVGITACFSIATTIAIVTFFCGPWIARAYTHDPAVVALAGSLLTISAVLQMGDGTQSAAAGALRGLKDTRVPMLINGGIYWGIGFLTAYVLGVVLNWQARGIWCGLALALCVAAVTLTLRFRYVVSRHIALASARGEVNKR